MRLALKKVHSWFRVVALLLAPLAALHAADTPKPSKPNIVVILADDKHESLLTNCSLAREIRGISADRLQSRITAD